MEYACKICNNRVDWNVSQEIRIVVDEGNVRMYSTLHLCEYCYNDLTYILDDNGGPTYVIIKGTPFKLVDS